MDTTVYRAIYKLYDTIRYPRLTLHTGTEQAPVSWCEESYYFGKHVICGIL